MEKKKIKLNKSKIKSNNFIKKAMLVLIATIILLATSLLFIYNYINYNIYEKISNNEDIIKIKYKPKKIILWDKTIEYIKNTDKKIYIEKENLSYLLNSNIKKCINLDTIINKNRTNIKEIEKYNNIEIKSNSNLKYVSCIQIKVDKKFFNNEYVDLYSINNKNKLVHIQKLKIEDNIIKININHKNISLYKNLVLTYIPIENIHIPKETMFLKKGEHKTINTIIQPSNATNKEINFIAENLSIIELSNNNILALKPGETDIKLLIKNEPISKNIHINVLEIISDIKLSNSNISLIEGNTVTITATTFPKDAFNNDLEWESSNEKIAKVENGKITAVKEGKCNIIVKNTIEPIIEKNIKVNVTTNETISVAASVTNNKKELTYIKGILLVNKNYTLPNNYNPGINPTAYLALQKLQKGAKNAGYSIPLLSGFRSYSTQVSLYNKYTLQHGEAYASTISAKAGQSEHQTGLAFDVGNLQFSYSQTKEGKWLNDNAHKYGFIIRYPKDKQNITGYAYEPWHIRYLGIDVATDIYNKGITLEEYLGVV